MRTMYTPGRLIKIAIALSLTVLTSCVASVPIETPPEIKWPMPPARTRIQFVDFIIGSKDVVSEDNSPTRQLLFGDNYEVPLNKPTFTYYRDGALYVSDLNHVKVFDISNKKFWAFGGGTLRNATGIAVLSDGTVYVGDSVQKCIYRFKPGSRQPKRITERNLFRSIGGLDINEDLGLLYAVNAKGHNIMVFDLDGNLKSTIGGRGAKKGEFNYPYDIKVGPGGRLYVTDAGNFRVQILSSKGTPLAVFGSVGTQLGSFARPKGIALDPDGNIYVLDAAFGNFQIFNQRGQMLLSIGSSGNEAGKHLLPVGIFINREGRIFVTEQGNRRVQIYQYISYEDEEKTPPPPLNAPQEANPQG